MLMVREHPLREATASPTFGRPQRSARPGILVGNGPSVRDRVGREPGVEDPWRSRARERIASIENPACRIGRKPGGGHGSGNDGKEANTPEGSEHT